MLVQDVHDINHGILEEFWKVSCKFVRRMYWEAESRVVLGLFHLGLKVVQLLKVEPYSILTSFSKLKYLKPELNVDSGTYAIV